MIKKVIKNNFLFVLLALMLGYWQTNAKLNGPVNIKLSLTIQTQAAGSPFQIYCHSFKEYTGDNRFDGQYETEYQTGPNTYRIVNDIACGDDTTHIRFDPLPGAGEITVIDMRMRGSYWHQVELSDAIKSMKPMNAIERMVLSNDGILIKAIDTDPYFELTDQVQSLIEPTPIDFLSFLLKYSAIAFLLLKMGAWVARILLTHGTNILHHSDRLKQRFDHHTFRITGFFHQHFNRPIKLSWVLVSLAFLVYLFSSFVFADHMVGSGHVLFYFSLAFLTLQFVVILACYIILLSTIGSHKWPRTLLGFGLLIVSILIAVDVSLFSLNGMHVSHGLGLLTHGGISQFFNNLKFTGLASSELAMYLFAIFAALILSLVVVWVVEHKFDKFKFRMSIYQALLLSVFTMAVIYGIQTQGADNLPSKQITKYENHHPIALSFYKNKDHVVAYDAKAAPFKADVQLPVTLNLNEQTEITNIYLFVFESLRENTISAINTPYLYDFRKQGWHFSKMVASGNASHFGWFAIINGQHPFFWERHARNENKQGSLPLQLFRQMGFKINVYSAKDLTYLRSDVTLFGKDLQLADYISEHPAMSPPEHDRRATNELLADMGTEHTQGKHLNIIFLDSTHYPYRWNETEMESIKPYQGTPAEGTDLSHAVRIMKSDKSLIYNRYRNAVKYMDYLFGEAMKALKTHDLNNRSVVAVVGDHGQQFMEHGYMLHGFTLFNEDIDVPIYFQGPNVPVGLTPRTAAHTDIMPTLLDLVGIESGLIDDLHGQSLLTDDKHDYRLSAVAGEQNTPYSYVLSSTEWKLFFKTENTNPTDFSQLFVTMITDSNDQPHIPGNGSQLDYVAFIEKHFPDFINQMVITP